MTKRRIDAMTYQEHKEQARRTTQALQVYELAQSWQDIAEQGEHLEKLAKRYGLIKEFKGEGIL